MKWDIDVAHTSVTFAIKHLGLTNVRGSFKELSGYIETNDEHDFESAYVEIRTNSVQTRDEERDMHLKNEDFFDVKKHPIMKFQSTSIVKINEDVYEVKGNLHIKNIAKEITFELTKTKSINDPFGFKRIGVEATTTIDRYDWGLKWNQHMDGIGLVLAKNVKITIEGAIVTK